MAPRHAESGPSGLDHFALGHERVPQPAHGVPDDADECPGSNLSPTVVIGGCDSGVPNVVLASGCSISDLIRNVAVAATSHGAFVSRVAHLLNGLQSAGVITAAQKNAIQSCAGSAAIP